MHDFTYHYGFDEAAGNYQTKNYTGEGRESDEVRAIAQFGADIPSTPNDQNPNNDFVNNANFTILPDGNTGFMRMYVWDRNISGAKFLRVDAPAGISGLYETATASFGTALSGTAVGGDIVEVNNGSNKLACTVPNNAAELDGKVALIDRGECDFSKKVFNVQQAGAVAAIICNFEDALIGGMAAGDNANDVTIPSIFIKSGDCGIIRGFLSEGAVTISMLQTSSTGPDSLDGSFDNGIIAHEYAHGISTRLTGGPGASSCLRDFDTDNDGSPDDGEQMGEGWSDFFSLITTVRPGDDKNMLRGVGTFVSRQENNGQGLRRYPYTTDMSVNPNTYENIITRGVPYGTGEVWATVLWDLYWDFVEEYGWDPDVIKGDKGNNIAIQLIMDGMKLQPCNPTMVDGRDAILMADQINNGGANQCLIWRTFAKRGLGFGADAGELFVRNDTRESFEELPSCLKTIKISKELTPVINPGEEIEVTLTITNHKEGTASGVTVTDEIPDGASLVVGSSNKEVENSGGVLSFDLGSLDSGQSDTISYKLNSAANKNSIRLFYDDMENGEDNWFPVPLEGTNLWYIDEIMARSGTNSFTVSDIATSSRQNLQIGDPLIVSGTQPVLRFFHYYDTEPAADGGFVEISKDGGVNWINAEPYIFRNPYRGAITYTTFAIPNLNAFWGKTDEFIATYIDLSSFIGEEILFQFRFATDSNTPGVGWFVDDVEYMDMYNYQSEACVSESGGGNVCTLAPEKGTIVESNASTPSHNPYPRDFEFQLYPNPARSIVQLSVQTEEPTQLDLQLFSIEGKLIRQERFPSTSLNELISWDVSDVAAGFYFVKLSSPTGSVTKKLVIE